MRALLRRSTVRLPGPEEHTIVERAGGQKRIASRILAALLAVALGLGGAALFAFGSCHDSGGFCAPAFSATHVLFYVVGGLVLSFAAGLLAAAVTARRRLALAIAAAAATSLLVLVLVVETAD